MDSHSHSHSNSESDILNEKKSHREEKPEALASPEQKHEQDTKSKRIKKKGNKEKGAEAEPNEHPPQVCPKPLVVPTPIPEEPKPNEITLVTTPIPEPKSNEATLPDPKDTPKKRKRERKKKNALNPNAENPELNKKKKEEEEEEKGEESNEANAQHLGECPKPPLDIAVATDLEKKKEAEPSEAPAPQPQPGPGGPTTPIGKNKRKPMIGRGRMEEMVENPMNALNHDQNQTQPDPPIPVCPKPVSRIDQTSTVDPAISAPTVLQTIPMHPAIPIDTEQKLSKNQRRRMNRMMRKSVLDVAQPNEHNIEQSETPVQTSICQTETPPIDPGMDPPHPVIPICPKPVSLIGQISTVDPVFSAPPISQTIPVDPAIPIGTEQKMSKYKRRKMRKRLLDGAQTNEHNIEQPETPVQTSICHTAAPPIGPTIPMDPHPAIDPGMDPHPVIPICPKPVSLIGQTSTVDPVLSAPPISQTIPVDPAIPIGTEQKMSRYKRRKMRKRLLDGTQTNEHNIEQPETPVQTSICHTAAPPIGPTIPMGPHPATPIDPEQTTSKKKRKRKRKGDLKSEGGKPNEYNGKPTETPVQKSITPIVAPSTDPTVAIDQTKPVDPATPIDPEQKMTENKSKRRRTSALNSTGSESDGHNADSTAEAPVQGTNGVTVTKAHTDGRRQRNKMCWACRRTDHTMGGCQILKSLSKDEEICFFCGEIGHSLGRCSVSLAGGGRFAKCLLCHAQGHFGYNCPGDGHGNYVKVVAANGPINKTVGAGREVHC